MSDRKSYAMFNALTITGRVSHAEVVKGQYGDFLSLTLLSELQNDAEAIAISIRSNNGLLSMFQGGRLNNGRNITVTGHIQNFSEVYTDKKTGKRGMRKRPLLTLKNAVVLDGGYGPGPKRDDSDVEGLNDTPPVDETPEVPTASELASAEF